MKATDPATIRKGDVVRFGSSRQQWLVEQWEEKRSGCMWLICCGPLDHPSQKCGNAFYVGPMPTTKINVITDKRERVRPIAVRVVPQKAVR